MNVYYMNHQFNIPKVSEKKVDNCVYIHKRLKINLR